jgi:predicted Ser/Thr protein kinase
MTIDEGTVEAKLGHQGEKTRLEVKQAGAAKKDLVPLPAVLEAAGQPKEEGARVQLQKHQLPQALNSAQKFADIMIVSFAGALVSFGVVFVTCALLPTLHPLGLIALLDISVMAGLSGCAIYLICALCPIWLAVCMLLLQALSGVFCGQVIIAALCSMFLIDPQTLGPVGVLLSLLYTFVFAVAPAFALPFYTAAFESSPLRRTLGALFSEYLVADLRGKKLSFRRAWMKAVLEGFESLLYPISVAMGNNYRDRRAWLEQATGTMHVRRPEKLEEEISKSKEKVMVRYRAFQELEGVLGQDTEHVPKVMRKEDLSFKRAYHAVWALSMVTLAVSLPVALLAPMACLRLILLNGRFQTSWTPASYGAGPMFDGWPQICFYLMAALFLYFLLAICRPTHIQLTKEGIRFIFKTMPVFMQDQICPWSKIKQVTLEQVPGKASVADHRLVFGLVDGKKMRLRLGSISSVVGKEEILKAVERWAPSVPRSSEVITALQPPCDFSYTELWMEALSAPPKREKLKPLIDGAMLREQQFTVLNMLGVGGQGTAYLAEDAVSAQAVVLKEFVLPVYVDVSARRRALETFEKEARLLKELSHPNVVKLVDYFIEDHRAYLVLEHIDGESLRTLVNRSGRLTEDKVRELAIQMCEILQYLHAQSPPVVHRDFTPDNLILRKDGTLKLIDFNVAQQSDSSAVSSVVGKPNYLPPEQFRGTPTTQSDIYALGACLQFLLIGENPVAILSSNPSLTRSDVSEALSAIVQKATEPELENRFSTASEILLELKD